MIPTGQHPCQLAVSEALQVISGKWAYFVISQLCLGPQRFNQLQRNVGGISIKSLTDTLRQLEQQQIVHRRVYPTVPVSVEYSLTEKGKEYGAILSEMRKWGEKWGNGSADKQSQPGSM
ncbi:winged helix-turn-helix transcriptional regulator [Paenibacillus hamazuiensis]|uniref:winged helix-turn-helix transcriptional regulator n=1 Tax=Paenibacillus hamazuiensis TaxID=2936508 RepID=UPI00200BB06C|nr:helix-turn-helix domain-containing protein [Paenibacillus hamazuiensis]